MGGLRGDCDLARTPRIQGLRTSISAKSASPLACHWVSATVVCMVCSNERAFALRTVDMRLARAGGNAVGSDWEAPARKEARRYASAICAVGTHPPRTEPPVLATREQPLSNRELSGKMHSQTLCERRRHRASPSAIRRSTHGDDPGRRKPALSAIRHGMPFAARLGIHRDDDQGRRTPALFARRGMQAASSAIRRASAAPTSPQHLEVPALSRDNLEARLSRKAELFWEARETLSLTLAVYIAAMIWLPQITGRPVVTILELPTLTWAIRMLLKPGQPPLM
jgi:hypothetical protein